MLERVLPGNVSVAAVREDVVDTALFAEEEPAVSGAVESRRREFATARACARAALGRWGLSGSPIPASPNGAPDWPPGIVGSITHCDGYRGCGVALAEDIVTVGLDAEPNEPLPEGVLGAIAGPRERAHVADLVAHAPRVRWDRLLFSMKEAVYKAWAPLTNRRLGFEDAVILVSPSSSVFTARLSIPGPRAFGEARTELSGRWLAEDGILLTAIAVPAPALGDR